MNHSNIAASREAPTAPATLTDYQTRQLESVDRMARYWLGRENHLAEMAAERDASGLRVGDYVRIRGGGHSDEYGTITGVDARSGLWELTLESLMPYACSSRGLELMTPAVDVERAAATLGECATA